MRKLTKKYEDGSYGVADNLPCGENSHAFKEMLIDTLGQYEHSTLSPMNWVSVDLKLPSVCVYDWVLVRVKIMPEGYYGLPHIAELRNGKWWFQDYEHGPAEEDLRVKVTHWMPLPEEEK